MSCVQGFVELTHSGRGACELYDETDIWRTVSGLASKSKITNGFVHLSVAGTPGVALSLNENCDPTVRSDLQNALEHIIPDDTSCPDALRAALIGTSIALPFESPRRGFITGTWQGIYLCDFRPASTRTPKVTVVVTVVPSTSLSSFHFDPPCRGCHDVSKLFHNAATKSSSSTTLALALLKHTSVSIGVTTRANAEPKNRGKSPDPVETTLNTVVPERWNREFFRHTYEGPDDMPAHVKCSLIGAGVVLPTSLPSDEDSCVPLLCEHRNYGGWGGGGRSCVVATASAPAKQFVVDIGAVDGFMAVGSKIKEAVGTEGESVGVANVLCLGGDGDVSLVLFERTDKPAEVLSPLRNAILLDGISPSAAATVLGRDLTLSLPLKVLDKWDVFAVCMSSSASKPCKLVVTIVH